MLNKINSKYIPISNNLRVIFRNKKTIMRVGLDFSNIPEDRINDLFYSFSDETDNLNMMIYISKLKIKIKMKKILKKHCK